MDLSPKSADVAFWIGQIDAHTKEFKDWEQRSKKIVKRYKNEEKRSKSSFNVLWSNVQTLGPALYASPPKPNIDRRFQDDDDLGRICALVMERAVSYFVHSDDFNDVMRQSVQDRLLPGRGTAWVRYVPVFSEAAEITDDTQPEIPDLQYEDVVVDYVHWQDFGHTVARTWQECRAVWRKVPMSRRELIKRFGKELGKEIPLDMKVMKESTDPADKACVYEIWDKVTRKAYWLHKDMPDMLDERDDPLHLVNFFPCPKPLYATMGNDNLVPSPDFYQYQDQAIELDMLTNRIEVLTAALRVVGVYDSTAEGLEDMMSTSKENTLIPVVNWAILGEKGGMQGVVDFFPMDMVVATLEKLYQAREVAKQTVYEITGISDIVRGASNANETATAQQIKGQYANLRLDAQQKDVARFSRDLIRIMAEIIAEQFDLETIKQVSGVKLMTNAEKQQVVAEQQEKEAQAAQSPASVGPDGQPMPPHPAPPMPDDVGELLRLPSWEDVEAILRDNMARCFRIDIETDSTIKTDQEAEKQARVEFLGAVSSFLQQAATVQDPALKPLLMELLQFGVQGFKVGRQIETNFDTAIAKLQKEAEAPQQPAPEDPSIVVAKMDAEEADKQRQFEGPIKAAEIKLKQGELMLKEQELKNNHEANMENAKVTDRKNRLDAKTAAGANSESAMMDDDMHEDGSPLAMLAQQMAESNRMMMMGLQQLAQSQQQGNAAIISALTAPKRAVYENGKLAGVEVVA